VTARLRRLIIPMVPRRAKSARFETALVVLVPSAEAHVSELRRRLDPDAMPAHITVLYPFVRSSSLASDDVQLLRRTLREFEPIHFELSEIGWFDDRVVYLVPAPSAPFQDLTRLLADVFPSYRPYGGQFAEIVPHLTVAQGASPSQLRDVATLLTESLPIYAVASAVTLMARNGSGKWETHTTFELGR